MIRTLFTMWLLAAAGLAWADEAGPFKPIYLVARPELNDANFHDSVVLLTRWGSLGAVGVIVNRRTEVPLSRALPEAASRLGPDDRLFFGGPVGAQTMTFAFASPQPRAGAFKVAEGAYASSSLELMKELIARDKPTEGLRVYAGLAGWGPGQLEDEIDRGDWRKVPVDAHSLLETKPELMWTELDRRASATLADNAAAAPAAR
jgi:putative transcriptional regulator